MIEARNVTRIYRRGVDEIRALGGVNLEVDGGRLVALMGPSGSGKSTLLHLFAGLDRPSGGTISVAGQPLAGLSEDELADFRSRNVGIVFQFYNLIPVMSARENVELPLLLTSLPKAEIRSRAEHALRIVGMGDRASHTPNQLSGGEQQRVAIARAIVTDPALVLADEPTGDLDASNAEAVLSLLRELCHELSKTVLLVTHDARAERFADAIYVLDKGVLNERLAPDAAERGSGALAG